MIFIDLLLTLTCIMVFTSFLIPSVKSLMSIQQDQGHYLKADEYLNHLLRQYSIDSLSSVESPLLYKNTEFYFHGEYDDYKFFGCLSWFNNRGEEKKICRYVPY
ncbi:hypothetical protein [Piscibacillus halophilus]|nr:hypothetical protein [Piscibacillus halophilus]